MLLVFLQQILSKIHLFTKLAQVKIIQTVVQVN